MNRENVKRIIDITHQIENDEHWDFDIHQFKAVSRECGCVIGYMGYHKIDGWELVGIRQNYPVRGNIEAVAPLEMAEYLGVPVDTVYHVFYSEGYAPNDRVTLADVRRRLQNLLNRGE